jgi:hypothetical protein
MKKILDSGERTTFESGAVRDMHTGKGRMDLLPVTAIIELSKHCEEGALKYGERNVDKGIPQHSFVDSGLRHLFKYLRGDHDENHLRAAAWNVMWALEQEVNRPELNDLPNREASEKVSCLSCAHLNFRESNDVCKACVAYDKWDPVGK